MINVWNLHEHINDEKIDDAISIISNANKLENNLRGAIEQMGILVLQDQTSSNNSFVLKIWKGEYDHQAILLKVVK